MYLAHLLVCLESFSLLDILGLLGARLGGILLHSFVDGTNKNSCLPGSLVHFACSPAAVNVLYVYGMFSVSFYMFASLPVSLVDSCACFEGVFGWGPSSFAWCYASYQVSDFGHLGQITDV